MIAMDVVAILIIARHCENAVRRAFITLHYSVRYGR